MQLTSEAIERAASRWPDLAVEREIFVDFISGRDDLDVSDDAIAELYLACGCHHRDATALALFESRYLDVVPMAVAHMKLGPQTVDEVRQLVRQKLLVAGDGEDTKLARYAGRGKLRGLIQVVAVRTAISLLRKEKRHAPAADELEGFAAADDDPELSVMKATYRAAFKDAFADALRALDSRDRNFLRLHHYGGLTVEQVGDVYGVHRATATRWLAKIRATLLSTTKKRLGDALDIPTAELDSLMVLIQSRLDVSVQRLLQSQPDPAQDD